MLVDDRILLEKYLRDITEVITKLTSKDITSIS